MAGAPPCISNFSGAVSAGWRTPRKHQPKKHLNSRQMRWARWRGWPAGQLDIIIRTCQRSWSQRRLIHRRYARTYVVGVTYEIEHFRCVLRHLSNRPIKNTWVFEGRFTQHMCFTIVNFRFFNPSQRILVFFWTTAGGTPGGRMEHD